LSPSLVSPSLAPPSGYWRASRAPRYSLLFALPLFVLYELLAATVGAGNQVRNGAEAIMRLVVDSVAGPWGPLVFGAALIGGSLWLVVRDRRRTAAPMRASIFVGMAVESVLLASLFGTAVALVTAQLLRPVLALSAASQVASLGLGERLMLSIGAGLYEELLFRVVLVTLIAALARRLVGVGPGAANAVAVVAGALLFSAAHYIGPYGDPLALGSFTFRFVAGLFFSALYVLRGFGITAWTHALYDVFLLVL
jgi:hypothetical protein